MQYQGLLLALAASTSALAIRSQDTESADFVVTNFYMSAIPEGSEVDYSLDIVNVGTQTSANCLVNSSVEGANPQCSGAPPLPGFTPEACNGDTGFSWAISHTETPTLPQQPALSLQLNYTYQDGSVVTACRLINLDEFTCTPETNDPSESDYVYQGQRSFNVTATSGTKCVYA